MQKTRRGNTFSPFWTAFLKSSGSAARSGQIYGIAQWQCTRFLIHTIAPPGDRLTTGYVNSCIRQWWIRFGSGSRLLGDSRSFRSIISRFLITKLKIFSWINKNFDSKENISTSKHEISSLFLESFLPTLDPDPQHRYGTYLLYLFCS
jgi:hypothetical protein